MNYRSKRFSETLRHLIKIVTLLGAAFGVIFIRSAPGARMESARRFLDVGQGDSALVTMPNGATLLIDGGRPPEIVGTGQTRRTRGMRPLNAIRAALRRVVSEYLWAGGLDHVDYISRRTPMPITLTD